LSRSIKEKAVDLLVEEGLSLNKSLGVVQLPKSSFYYQPKAIDYETMNEIRRLAFRWKREGYRRIYRRLRRSGKTINHKKVYRLYCLEGLKIRTKPKRKKRNVSSIQLPLPKYPNEVWSMDFVFERTIDGKKQRILTGIDHLTRENTILHAEYTFSSEKLLGYLNTLEILPRAFVLDNGTEFTSKVFQKWAEDKSIEIHFIEKGKPTQNAFIESFNGKLRDECLNLHYFKNQRELTDALRIFQKEYNDERLHSSLNYLTPSEFKQSNG
jgi:putative transposase